MRPQRSLEWLNRPISGGQTDKQTYKLADKPNTLLLLLRMRAWGKNADYATACALAEET